MNPSPEYFDRVMDAVATVYGFKAGRVLTEDDVEAVQLFDTQAREDGETALDAFSKGYRAGQISAGGKDVAAVLDQMADQSVKHAADRAILMLGKQRAFWQGAQACREMMARFVEQGGDLVTAQSIRLNWNPEWGKDPGPPDTRSAASTARSQDGSRGPDA